ncbi:NAD(P)-dependent oxidoreductase [Clostridium sp. BSD9I1]|uniref:NAD(P)-dependent oxidoreductase n=1 Tax=Clostridium sp. BSD9I1 TaxID=2003589 RepID=UPI0016482A8A|nr:NAD(P)-dependent oxidoreductase [Clostridium sp. BSD9I1]
MKWKVLVTAPYMQKEIDRFEEFFKENEIEIDVPLVEERMEEAQLIDIIEKYDGVISGDDRFTEKVFAKAKKLKVISKWGTGIDSIDRNAAKTYGVKVCNTPDAFSHPVADTVMAMILSFSRTIIPSDKAMKNREWIKIKGKALSEQTIGIIGMGNIGMRVARRAQAFGMKIISNDIREISNAVKEQYDIEEVSKEELYKRADYITLNCDLNETSYHLLTEKEFAKMERKPIIINTARGPIIKEKDLVEALKNNMVSGAGLDVFEFEPLPKDSPLRSMENVILSSHNSNSSPKYWEKVHQNTLNNLLKGLLEK